ncbi:hypothetical protein Bca101_048455 [Brassica carinata]
MLKLILYEGTRKISKQDLSIVPLVEGKQGIERWNDMGYWYIRRLLSGGPCASHRKESAGLVGADWSRVLVVRVCHWILMSLKSRESLKRDFWNTLPGEEYDASGWLSLPHVSIFRIHALRMLSMARLLPLVVVTDDDNDDQHSNDDSISAGHSSGHVSEGSKFSGEEDNPDDGNDNPSAKAAAWWETAITLRPKQLPHLCLNSEAVSSFYAAINVHGLAYVSDLITQNCSYKDLVLSSLIDISTNLFAAYLEFVVFKTSHEVFGKSSKVFCPKWYKGMILLGDIIKCNLTKYVTTLHDGSFKNSLFPTSVPTIFQLLEAYFTQSYHVI